jgi:lipoprotein-anchoring transpeptidase ErfK/SrfK
MMRLSVAVLALAGIAVSAPAQAFHPFEESYGYVMPNKFKRKGKAAADEGSPSLFATSPKKAKIKAAKIKTQDEESDEPVQKKKKKSAKGPATMSGGGKPHISPVAPPTVTFPNSYGAGTIVIDTAGRKLYYVLSSSSAYKYPIAVGREGFTWSGKQKISREVAWPDWTPPKEMLERKPELPEFMSGGIRNPLGAKALYLGNTLYRIHGTNDSKSIGTASSSGCIRMTNGHVTHLASIAGVGTTVHVLNKLPKKIAAAAN